MMSSLANEFVLHVCIFGACFYFLLSGVARIKVLKKAFCNSSISFSALYSYHRTTRIISGACPARLAIY